MHEGERVSASDRGRGHGTARVHKLSALQRACPLRRRPGVGARSQGAGWEVWRRAFQAGTGPKSPPPSPLEGERQVSLVESVNRRLSLVGRSEPEGEGHALSLGPSCRWHKHAGIYSE